MGLGHKICGAARERWMRPLAMDIKEEAPAAGCVLWCVYFFVCPSHYTESLGVRTDPRGGCARGCHWLPLKYR